jgi:hypothetical protein
MAADGLIEPDSNLERRYRRVLRLLPGWYREQWEQDMVAAFLDSRLAGDGEADACITEVAWPGPAEVVSVAGLAVRLYLGGAGAPRRYFAWGQALRNTALAVTLVRAVGGLEAFVSAVRAHSFRTWLPVLARAAQARAHVAQMKVQTAGTNLAGAAHLASTPTAPSGGLWPTVFYTDGVGCAWIVVFLALVFGSYRAARVIAVLAAVPALVQLLSAQITGSPGPQLVPWAFLVLFGVLPILTMIAFHQDAPPAASRPWLLAAPAGYLLVAVPLLALQATGNSAWLPDFSGLCCILVALACLAHAPSAWSRQAADSSVWSLTLTLLAVVAGLYRLITLSDYLPDPHLLEVSLAELLVLLAAAALVAPDAARSQSATPGPPRYPRTMAA